jgi:glycosyltransferase involved in cell wall biosynthesis
MKILELSRSGTIGTSDMGPISTVVYELAREFARHGHDVNVVDAPAIAPRDILPDGVKLIEIGSHTKAATRQGKSGRLMNFTKSWWHNYQFIREVSSQVDLDSFDVIHTHSPTLTFLLQRICNKACVYTAHSSYWAIEEQEKPETGLRRKMQLRRLISRSTEISAIRGSVLTIALGDYLKRSVKGAKNIRIIPSGLHVEDWQPLDQTTARQALSVSASDFVLVFIGRISPVKGIDVLLDAVRSLAPKINNLRVFIIGSPGGGFNARSQATPYATKLMNSASDLPVEFLGFISNRSEKFIQYLSAADLAIIPSRMEPQGRVVLEALVLGTPVVASETGGIPIMVTKDVGRLFPPGDSRALASIIEELHLDREQLELMTRNARKSIEERYRWSSVAEQYLSALSP